MVHTLLSLAHWTACDEFTDVQCVVRPVEVLLQLLQHSLISDMARVWHCVQLFHDLFLHFRDIRNYQSPPVSSFWSFSVMDLDTVLREVEFLDSSLDQILLWV